MKQEKAVTKHPVLSAEFVMVTPDMAVEWLLQSGGNRPIRARSVHKYVRDIGTDRWIMNGETIKFDVDNELIDGHHRLSAIVESGVALMLLVVRGLPKEAKYTIDAGATRSFYDIATMAGLDYNRRTGAIAGKWLQYQNGFTSSRVTFSFQELNDAVVTHPSIDKSAEWIERFRVIISHGTPSVQGFVHAYASEFYDRELADEFITKLDTGENLSQTSPIYQLRKTLVEDRSKRYFHATTVLAYTIKAWNAFVNGDEMKLLRWINGGSRPEPFPVFSVDKGRQIVVE